MHYLLFSAALAAVTVPLAAQPNPFKPPKAAIKGIQVAYALSGDLTGTALLASDGERTVHRQTGTTKLMGKTSTTNTWTMTTPDSTFSADLTKQQGIVVPNMLGAMAEAYDDLDGAAKKRLQQNTQDMGAMLSRIFNLGGINAGEKLGIKTYAGQECEERKFGPMTVCTMNKAPIMLHSQISLVCFNLEETATEVKLASPSGDVFAPPAGVVWKWDPRLQKPDSVAKGLVLYLASQQLADSLAKVKAELQAAQAKAGESGKPPEFTAEQQAGLQQACEKLKNFDMGKALADATNQAMKEIADAAKRQAVESAKSAATSKIKGLFKKPSIP